MGEVNRKYEERGYIPGLTEALIAHLEYLFPPRCQGPTENGNAHQRYAGKVELVQMLREAHTTQTSGHLAEIDGALHEFNEELSRR